MPSPAADPWVEPSDDVECVSLSGLRTLILPYRQALRPLQRARHDFEVAARLLPRPLVERALSVQLLQDGGDAFARRVGRMHSRAAPCQRNEILALLLIGCGHVLALQALGDSSVEVLARHAFGAGADTSRQIAELCTRLPSLPLALDHVDLADILARLLTWAAFA